ncbi:hypothetical protein OWV82_007790 [Melia azedarach]|uniref:Uncharacterized protein n=1 Tax=Melia azedarach TaxID=155640 RepID=A0ACC1Y7Y2_MELAZ|nr:hypothetical protein OWV82_007790 [Melia azedarach]
MASSINSLLFIAVLFAAAAISTTVGSGAAPAPAGDRVLAGGISEATLLQLQQEGKLPKGLWKRMHRDPQLKQAIEANAPLPAKYDPVLSELLGRPAGRVQPPESSAEAGKDEKAKSSGGGWFSWLW